MLPTGPRTPVLVAGGLLLRPWRRDAPDRSLVLRAAADPAISRYSSVGTAITVAAADEWLAGRTELDRRDWVVESGSTPVGRVSLASIDLGFRSAEIGYWVLPEHRRRGFARDGAFAAIRHAVHDLGLTTIRIEHEPANSASCAVAAALSFGVCRPADRPVRVGDGMRHLSVHVRRYGAEDP